MRDSASNGITAVYNNDNSITISGQATSNYAYLSNAINCTLPIGTYTLSIDKKLPYRTYINCKYTDNTSGNYIIETNTLTKTFTTSKIIQTVTLILSDIVSGTTYNETIYFQLEEGSQATPYSPYTANPIELNKIGNYQDSIYYENNKWYIEKKVGKILINPNLISSFQNIKTISKEARVTKTAIDCLQGNVARYFCDTFNYMTNTWNIDEIGIFSNSGNNNDQIAFRIPVDSDKTFFDSYPTTLYYQLAEATTSEITDTNLLSQLEAIKNATLISGTNEITQTPSDLPFILNFKYYMKG